MELVFGMKDVHPPELKIRRHIEELLSKTFETWGYEEADTPTLEYHATFNRVLGEEQMKQVYQFVTRGGKLVCLRPEFTTSIARMYSRKFAEKLIPARVYYAGKIFRLPSSPFRSETELTQVGCEHIGTTGSLADAEMIALTLSALKNVGIEDCVLDIGHVGFIRGIIGALELDPESRELLIKSVRRKDFQAIRYWIETGARKDRAPARLLVELPFLRGGEEILDRHRNLFPRSDDFRQAEDNIRKIYARLREFRLDDSVFLNLGLTRDYDYYTGLIFEGFSPHVGYPLVVGGRYDELFRLFGKNYPACGLVFFTERLVEVFQKTGSLPIAFHGPLVIHHPPGRCAEAFTLACELRTRGIPVVAEEDGRTQKFRFTRDQAELPVYDCDPEQICRILQGGGQDE
ncbi:MAG TPA: ATP phosphoribosyltransferase regulatory subunit [Atribacteraceae bacterium]|nr:ATP phosphoribosyltransferase regulatory subunit [Atribacteraceae bacterium]